MRLYQKRWIFYTFLLCFADSNYTIDLFNAPIKSGQTIAIYTGAFDPPHLGHDEVIRYALSHGIDYVIVAPDSKFNRYKPLMTSVK
jgi:cytidyltransferase-like protein